MGDGLATGRFRIRFALLFVAALLAIAAAAFAVRGQGADTRRIGLFTSLPIVWRETGQLSDLLQGEAPVHWARGVIEAQGRLEPLDTLAGHDGKLGLPRDALLVMAQPRPLSPAENVALDDWVRGGGRLLLFADPMLTADSTFALGDKRRPQDIVLLSPILDRWGLDLQFDEDQAAGERTVMLFGAAVPVNLPGRFAPPPASCASQGGGVAVRCRIGRGELLAVADASLLEEGDASDIHSRERALSGLLEALSDGK